MIGASALIVGPIIKKLLGAFGTEKLAFIERFFDERKEVKSKILDAYDSVAAIKVGESQDDSDKKEAKGEK